MVKTTTTGTTFDDSEREQYERDLRRRQEEHLRQVHQHQEQRHPFQPCMHDMCPSCHGTGVKIDGTVCIHGISCQCPKCSPH